MTTVAVTPRGFRQTPGPHRDLLKASGLEVRFATEQRPLTADELSELLEGCAGVILGVDEASESVLRAATSLTTIVRFGIGTDNVDLAIARELGIRVSLTLGATTTSVAELSVGLMLAAARSIPMMDRAVRAGSWSRANGIELAGRTLGLVGTGRIGREVAARARAFDMTVIGYDPLAQEGDIPLVSLDDLVARSDVISIHAPYTAETHHLVDADFLAAMRPGSLLVNSARGGIVDEVALAHALVSGPLAAAALDSFEQEPLPADSPLRDVPNVIFTPHCGAATVDAIVRAGVLAVEELMRGLANEPMLYDVTR
ncbi:unannotated protein [freshwater metagenome]|uniref:Unannotated protein n=1 Tax=freshwater metagenome TaxID=449393 RepID=A0A6J7NYZ7_9ZZZZ